MNKAVDFPERNELSGIVRKYVLAWVNANRAFGREEEDVPVEEKVTTKRSYSDISAESLNVDIAFGQTDAKALGKRVKDERSAVRSHNRRLEKEARLAKEEQRPKLVDPTRVVGRPAPPAASELAELAERAKQALARAEELAGEPVVYCCGGINIERLRECNGKCDTIPRYQAVNAL